MKLRSKHTPRPQQPPRSAPAGDAAPQLVTIEKPIYGGNFLARIGGKAVFVPLALPGEELSVRFIEQKKSYASAEPVAIHTPSPARIAPACPHFAACGGCAYQHTDYATQLEFKLAILRETLERAGVPAPENIDILSAAPWAYRNRIRLAFDAAGNPGYRGRRSHAIVPIRECPIAAPLLVRAALAAAEILRASALQVSELSLFANPDESALLATLSAASVSSRAFDAFAQALHEHIPQLSGAELVAAATEDFQSTEPRALARWGASSLEYFAAGFRYRVDNGAFFQVNRFLIDSLVDRVTAGHTGSIAWDLFAGAGLFARRLTANFDHVIAVESAPPAAPALSANLAGTNAEAVNADTLAFLHRSARGPRPDLIVVDPPRAGLGSAVTDSLAQIAPPELVYVSCDPATLARDLRALVNSGYRIHSVTLADLFPQTFHLETVVRLHCA